MTTFGARPNEALRQYRMAQRRDGLADGRYREGEPMADAGCR